MDAYGDFRNKTDDELVIEHRPAQHGMASVEMMRRLKESLHDLKDTLHAEERAIRRLTAWLVA